MDENDRRLRWLRDGRPGQKGALEHCRDCKVGHEAS